jgi:replicative DNA helicase
LNYTPEKDLLLLLLNKSQFHSYIGYIDQSYIKDVYKELHYVYVALSECHSLTENDLRLDDLQAYFFQKYPDADKETYLALFKGLSETTLDPSLGVAMLKQIKARKTALNLSEQAFKFSSGSNDSALLAKAIHDYSTTLEEAVDQFDFVSTDLDDVLDSSAMQPGLRWRLDFLNKSLGSLRKGDFGFLFARPETGKTTFLASEVSEMLRNLGPSQGPVIWFNNEEVGDKVMLRMYQAYFGVRLETILSNRRKYRDEFREQVGDKFLLLDNALYDRNIVEGVLKRFNPSLIIYDQIDKIKGFAADRDDLRLGSIYQWARELAKLYAPSIGVCQADGSAEGQKWLTMDHVANAKTSKQAEADWILAIGKQHVDGAEFIRYLSICKNKLLGDEDSIEHLRHGRSEVLIQPEIARYKDIVKYE